MEQLNDREALDPVSQLLRAVRVRSTVYCRSVMGAPWGFGVDAGASPAFHVVSAGGAWLQIDGEPEQVAVSAGDLVVLPVGRRHWMRDDPATRATELDDILARAPLDDGRRLRHGGNGATTTLVCGGFALEVPDPHPLLRALPPVLHVRGSGGRPVAWVAATLDLLGAETASGAPGAEAVVTCLADVLLTQALRSALLELHANDGQGLLALRDPQIADAIGLIHGRPEHAWSVAELADAVALSRSAFSARFRRLVGESPSRYVSRTRLARAAALLSTSDAPLAQVAVRAGYGSEFSFAKAFKRAFGIAPGAYRGRAAV